MFLEFWGKVFLGETKISCIFKNASTFNKLIKVFHLNGTAPP